MAMKILLKGEFDDDDLKDIAVLVRRIEQKHGGNYHMMVDDPSADEAMEDAERRILGIWPEAGPFDVVKIKKEKP